MLRDAKAELEKAEHHKSEHANGCFDMRCWDCKQYAKPDGFGGWDAIEAKFAKGAYG